MEIKLLKLKRFNLIMGFFHLIQGIAMLFLSTSVIQKIAAFQPVIVQNYLRFDQATRSLVLDGKELFTLPFGYFVSSSCLCPRLLTGSSTSTATRTLKA